MEAGICSIMNWIAGDDMKFECMGHFDVSLEDFYNKRKRKLVVQTLGGTQSARMALTECCPITLSATQGF